MKKKKIVDSELPEILKPYNEEIKRHMSALSEEFQGRIEVIGEGLQIVQKDIKEIKQTLDSHTEMIGQLVVDVDVLKTDMREVKQDVSVLKQDVKEIKGALKTKVDAKEVLRIVKANVV